MIAKQQLRCYTWGAVGLNPHQMSLSPHSETDWSGIRVSVNTTDWNFDHFCSQNL